MGLTPKEFVSLDRRFERSLSGDHPDLWSDILSDGDNPRDWAWLRQRSRVIALLAQAGSGKTFEFMHQVDQEREAGREAFFFRIERLCAGSVDEAHETPDCRRRFEQWLGGSGSAEIFLDSVDEAKLPQARSARPLRDALGKLSAILEPHFDRIAVFVSCRSSEWFDEIEQRALENLAVSLSAKQADAEPILVANVTFAPLDIVRIGRLAEDYGGDEAIALLSDSEAISDIVTPLDAILYLDTYREFKGTPDLTARFASRGQLLDTSVRRRLTEQGGETRRSQVEYAAGLRAAQYLAFASIVAQTLDIAIGGPRKDCINPEELLARGHASLSPDAIRQLLACSLFVPAGQARVRFYRPEARAMLAAQWLHQRINEGATALAVTDRFIKTVFGKPRVPVPYGSMLAWLAAYDPVARRRMIQAAPEWIIEDGDTRNLALEDRTAALDQHVRLGPHRFHGEFVFDTRELHRFARPELEEAVVGHLAARPAGDLLHDLLQFAEAGRYASAAPSLVGLLTDPAQSAVARMFAIRALIACGSEDDLRAVALHWAAIGGTAFPAADEPFQHSRNDRFLLDLVTAAYPGAIDVSTALALLGQLQGKSYSYEAKSFGQWTETIAEANLEAWLVGLDRLCFSQEGHKPYQPFGHDMPPLHPRATVLLRAFVSVATRYVERAATFQLERDILIYDRIWQVRHLGSEYAMPRDGSQISAAVASRKELRCAIYEALSGVEKRKHTILAYRDHVWHPSYFADPMAQDLRWLTGCYRQSSSERQEDYADAVLFLAARSDRPRRWAARLSLARAAAGRTPCDWATIREAMVSPLLSPWKRYRTRQKFQRYDRDGGLRSIIRRHAARLRLRCSICWNWKALRSGAPLPLLAQLVLVNGHQAPSEEELVGRRGKRLGKVLVDGTCAYARTYRAVDRNRIVFNIDILAQAGLRYIWNADHAMAGVDPTEALRAALYFALDWPDWATQLAREHPGPWANLVVPLLAREIAAAPIQEQRGPGRFLGTVAYLDEELRASLSVPLFAAIQSLRVIDGPDIDRVIRILAADPAIEARLATFAARHAREAWHEGAARRALNWLAVWAEHDSIALYTLLSWMAADPTLLGDGLSTYVRLFGERSEAPPPPLDLRYRFAMLAYGSIRPEDDPPLQEGVRETTSRDNLQQLRGSTGELLAADFDTAERAALEALIEAHIVPVSPDWAERWRHRYEQRAVKPAPWPQAAILGTEQDLATPPASGDDLLARVGDMIAELEQELASSEFDRRGLFADTILESDFRAWLGHALDSRRRQRFSIVQEAETAAAARTDLRIELRSTGDALVVVEIKLAHRWDYEDLIDKFRSQLVNQYLISPRVQHGIYLLVDLGKSPRNTMADGSKPSITEVAKTLAETGEALAASGGPIAKVQVFTIAPSKRNLREGAKKSEKAARKKAVAAPPRKGTGHRAEDA